MGINANSGSFRHIFEWYIQPNGSDDQGEPLPKTKIYDKLMGNIRTQSGNQLQALGAVLTDEVITVLTWYDPRVDNSFFIRYNNLDYLIQNIKPDDLNREMIITARVQRDG